MKNLCFPAAVLSLALLGCNRDDSAHRDDHQQTPGEKAGQAAYELQKDAKKAAKEAANDLKTFSRDAREGFQDAKQKDLERKKVKENKENKENKEKESK